jgi:hypothetical protein
MRRTALCVHVGPRRGSSAPYTDAPLGHTMGNMEPAVAPKIARMMDCPLEPHSK